MKDRSSDKTPLLRQLPVIIAVGLILIGCIIVLKPFIPAILLACILCLSTWPAFTWLETKLKGRTNLAALLMTLLLATCFLAPLIFLGGSLGESFSALVQSLSKSVNTDGGINTPPWAKDAPLIGHYLDEFWSVYISDQRQLTQTLSDHSSLVTEWLITIGAIIGHGVLDIALGVVLAFFLFRHGPTIVKRMHNLIDNFGGGKGQHLMQVCARTVIGVVYGILGTALVLAALATIGFWIARVPGAPFLGLVTFLLSIIPSGPYFILVPVTVWLFMQGRVHGPLVIRNRRSFGFPITPHSHRARQQNANRDRSAWHIRRHRDVRIYRDIHWACPARHRVGDDQ